MIELEGSISAGGIVRLTEQLRETRGDGGCWSEVFTGAVQRANALQLYPPEEREPKAAAIAAVLAGIGGNHNDARARELCRKLEEIVPLSSG